MESLEKRVLELELVRRPPTHHPPTPPASHTSTYACIPFSLRSHHHSILFSTASFNQAWPACTPTVPRGRHSPRVVVACSRVKPPLTFARTHSQALNRTLGILDGVSQDEDGAVSASLDTIWVVLQGTLVVFMQVKHA